MNKDRTNPNVGVLNAPAASKLSVRGWLQPRTSRNWYVVAFLVPAVTLVTLFYILPNVLNVALSLTDWSSYKSQINFIGLRNFIELYDTGELWAALWVTIRYAVFVMVVENTVALGLAMALEESNPINLFLRSVFFIPVLFSTLAAGYVYAGFFQPDGVFNHILSGIVSIFGLQPIETAWLGRIDISIYVVALVHAWKWGGVHMFVYIAGLKAIPHELVEAARVEGANALQVFRHVRFPLLAPAITFNVTLTLVGALSIFDIIISMTRGGPGRASEVLNLAVWRQFGTGAFAYATSMSTILLIVIVLVAVPLIIYLRRREIEL